MSNEIKKLLEEYNNNITNKVDDLSNKLDDLSNKVD